MCARRIRYADDDTNSTLALLWLRIPFVFMGLVLGTVLSIVTSRFEDVINQRVEIVFFLPFIIYMADAVGTQTEAIYTRDLRTRKAQFRHYLVKESFLGILFGLAAGSATAGISWIWLHSPLVTLTVSLSMFTAVTVAPLNALLITQLLQSEHRDPAVGAGPLATVIQDTVSVLIFGFVASFIML